MKRWKRICSLMLALVLIAGTLAGCAGGRKKKTGLDPKKPVTVTVWHYYNGAQQQAFNEMVQEFNNTLGKELGIVVEGVSQGSVTDLENNVIAAADGNVGASEVPNIFAAYADTAYAMDRRGMVVDLSGYLEKGDKEKYVDSYWAEGELTDNALKIFPIAKSMEVFIVNQTDWDKFASAANLDSTLLENITMEELTDLAKQYYEWTDSLTAQPNDGKALFGRDAMANYMLIGAKQLGMEIFSVQNNKVNLHFDKDVIRKLWDNYYVPYINGYFSSAGRFRSDDVKTGTVAAFIGSSSGATFFPDKVIVNDTQSYPIEMQPYRCPVFEGGEQVAVQQGAGMVVTQNEDKREIYASVEFLKWFTSEERNTVFSVSSGYVPVVKSAYDKAFLQSNVDISEEMKAVIGTAIDTANVSELYTPRAFANGTSARSILENAMQEQAKNDRNAVKEKMAAGIPHDQAVALYDTNENFDAWYTATKTQLEAAIEQA